MPSLVPLTLASTAATLCLAAALAHLLWQDRARRQRHATERAAWQELVRLTRLTAGELRGLALSLLGHGQIATEPQRAFLLSAEAALLDLTDALVRQADDPGKPIVLRAEPVVLAPVVDFVVGRVARQLGPGRRNWRLAPGLAQLELRADRRALHQILLRVLSSAALATGEGDCIEIAAEAAEGGWLVVIQDEGVGMPIAKVVGEGKDTRGLGVGLSLAHCLMQAHGGTLTIDSTLGVGSRARMFFPAQQGE
jgi:signal transduction histidine kinase